MDNQENMHEGHEGRTSGRILAGLFVLGIGSVFFMKELGYEFPWWMFTWPSLLIAIGIFSAFRNGFHGHAWAILIIVGGVFLFDEIIPEFSIKRFAWPLAIIAVGLLIIVRPRRNNWKRRWDWQDRWERRHHRTAYAKPVDTVPGNEYSSEDFFDSTSVFGGVKKIILSKNFRGADITCFLGGCEIDLSQADMQSPAVIDITQIFGGTKLIIPSNWQVRTDVTSIFAGIEDKRKQPLNISPDKLLILNGTSIFGGIEIKNY